MVGMECLRKVGTMSELDQRIKRNRYHDSGRPSVALKEPFWFLVSRVRILSEAFPTMGLEELLESTMEYLETNDTYRSKSYTWEH